MTSSLAMLHHGGPVTKNKQTNSQPAVPWRGPGVGFFVESTIFMDLVYVISIHDWFSRTNFTSAQTNHSDCWKIHKNIYQREEDYLSVQPQETKKSLLYSWARGEHWMGLLGKVAAVKAVKGHKAGKEEAKKEEAAKTEEKKWKQGGKPGIIFRSAHSFFHKERFWFSSGPYYPFLKKIKSEKTGNNGEEFWLFSRSRFVFLVSCK